jgi:hypothetical protein
MPKITSQPIHRLHINLLETEYLNLSHFARENHTSISKIIRELISELIISDRQITKKIPSTLDLGEINYD